MKNSLGKIFIVLLVSVLILSIININYVYASEATISVSSAKVNEKFIVTVNIPSDAVSYEGKIEVTFGDGTTQSSGKLVKVTGFNADGSLGEYSHPGNMSATFTASSSGNAIIKVIGLAMSSRSGQRINSQTELTKTINIEPVSTSTTGSNSGSSSGSPSSQTPSANEPTWNNTGDTVYSTESLNVRSSWSTSSSIVGGLSKGQSVKRIAVGSNGWDKINYNGSTAYVMSKYLTTKKPNESGSASETEDGITWKNTGDTVYTTISVKIRSGAGTTFDVVGGLNEGDTVKRIAVGSNGWDKINYNGNAAYVMSKYLTDKKPDEQNTNKVDNTNKINNTNKVDNTNVVENKVLTNEEIYNQIVDDIGVLPTVGKNVVDYIFGIGVVLAMFMIAILGVKIREKKGEF